MRILCIGDQGDVRGFALAGLSGLPCRDRRDVEAALARVAAHEPDVGLLLVSATVAALAPRAVEALRGRDGGPVVLVLPGGGSGP